MNCLNEQQIFDFINHELPADEMQVIEQHLKKCSSCKEIFDQENTNINAVKNAIGEIEIPQIQLPKFNFPGEESKVITKRFSPLILRLSIAASLIILLSLSIIILNHRKQSHPDLQMLQIEQEMLITDMNDAWHKREIIFTKTDTKTGETEFFLSSASDK